MNNVLATLAAGMAFVAASAINQGAEAAFVDSTKYCSHTSYSGVLTTGAVNFTVDGGGTHGASDCHGAFDIKEAKSSTLGGKEIDVLNAIWGSGLTYLGKLDVGTVFNPDGDSLGGLEITGISSTATGWSVTWNGNGALPMTIDLAVLLKAGSGNAGGGGKPTLLVVNEDTVQDAGSWWLPSVHLDTNSTGGSGSFAIEWENNGGNIPDLSNLTLAAIIQQVEVPEPGTLAILGFGLAGLSLGVARRRRAV